MFTICQHLYTFGEEVYFTRSVEDFTWRLSDCEELSGELLGVVSDCKELVGLLGDCLTL